MGTHRKAGRQRRVEHADAGQQHEDQHHLHGAGDPTQQVSHLGEDGIDIEQGHAGEIAHQPTLHLALRVVEVEGGDIAVAEALQHPGWEDDEEVGAKAVPVQVAQAAHLADDLGGTDGKGQGVTQPQAKSLGQAILHGDRHPLGLGRRGGLADHLGIPAAGLALFLSALLFTFLSALLFTILSGLPLFEPGADDEAIALRQRLAPGEIELTAQGIVATRLSGYRLARCHVVDGGDTPAHHGVEGAAGIGGTAEGCLEGLALVGLDIDGEIVGRLCG